MADTFPSNLIYPETTGLRYGIRVEIPTLDPDAVKTRRTKQALFLLFVLAMTTGIIT